MDIFFLWGMFETFSYEANHYTLEETLIVLGES